jgi:hypothetical protein
VLIAAVHESLVGPTRTSGDVRFRAAFEGIVLQKSFLFHLSQIFRAVEAAIEY